MTLEYAILGFLNYEPSTGYDLKKMFDISVRHFWYADQSQIYRTLAHLTKKGWVEVEVVEQTERPDRKVYHITTEGQAELRRWLTGPFPMQEAHSGPLVQVFFSGQLTDNEVRAKFEMAFNIFNSVLQRYQGVPTQAEEYIQKVNSPREAFFWMLTLELGRRTMQLQKEWAEEVLRLLDENKIPAE